MLYATGGRHIYDASRRILHSTGSFVSLVGDELGPATVSRQWKSGLRSIRRAFVKKVCIVIESRIIPLTNMMQDRKAISYWLPMLNEEDRKTPDNSKSVADLAP